jgi:hypothetical protein
VKDDHKTQTADKMPAIWAQFLKTNPGPQYKPWDEMTDKEREDLKFLADDMMKRGGWEH